MMMSKIMAIRVGYCVDITKDVTPATDSYNLILRCEPSRGACYKVNGPWIEVLNCWTVWCWCLSHPHVAKYMVSGIRREITLLKRG